MNFNLRARQPFKFKDLSAGMALMKRGAISPLEFLKGVRSDERVARFFSGAHRKAGD
jgi:hypothetical protein